MTKITWILKKFNEKVSRMAIDDITKDTDERDQDLETLNEILSFHHKVYDIEFPLSFL